MEIEEKKNDSLEGFFCSLRKKERKKSKISGYFLRYLTFYSSAILYHTQLSTQCNNNPSEELELKERTLF